MAARGTGSGYESFDPGNASGSEGNSSLSEVGSVHSSGTTNIESEPESDDSRDRNRTPLWYLVLHETEYALLSNGPHQLLTHAIAPFQ